MVILLVDGSATIVLARACPKQRRGATMPIER
jgi:hypothetical protein